MIASGRSHSGRVAECSVGGKASEVGTGLLIAPAIYLGPSGLEFRIGRGERFPKRFCQNSSDKKGLTLRSGMLVEMYAALWCGGEEFGWRV